MNTAEEKETAKVEVKQMDSLYFVVRELDVIHKRIDKVEETISEHGRELKEDIQKTETSLEEDIRKTEASLKEDIRKTEASLKEDIRKTEASLREDIRKTEASLREDIQKTEASLREDIKGLHSFMIKLTFSMAALIIAGIGIMFQIMK